jgi:ATP-binding cassette, subfamily B, multidrug efflux pump
VAGTSATHAVMAATPAARAAARRVEVRIVILPSMIRALSRLLPYLLRVRSGFVVGLLAALVATALSLVAPWVIKFAIDDLTQGADRRRLAVYALMVLGLAVGDGAFRYLMRIRLIGASRQVEYELRNDFFAHLERLPLSYYQANRTGDLMSRATNDLAAVRMLVGPAIMYFVSTTLGFVIAVGIMLWIDVRLTVVALLPLPGVTAATWYFGGAIHDRFERIQARLSDMSAVVQEALSGVRVVRAYRQEPAELARFRQANDDYVASNRRLIRLQSAFYPSLTLCFGISGLLVIWTGGADVVSGRLTLGEFVAFSRYLVLLAWPLIAFGWVINILQRGVASWERMLEVLDAPPAETVGTSTRLETQAITRVETQPALRTQALTRLETQAALRTQAITRVETQAALRTEPPTRPETQTALRTQSSLRVRHLTFRYPSSDRNVLEDVSFTAAPGETVAIIGPTGSGKSTIAALLTRLHEPPRGTISIDGEDVLDQPLARLRTRIGVVPQEPFLFSDTVGGNVALGLGEWGGEEIRARSTRAAETAWLASDVADFPNGFDTVVGERGITLSGGQKQRVALARALAIDPAVLVLDDALSAVDTATEEQILTGLRRSRGSRTSLMIAHRVSTIRDADLILVLVDGRIVERGTHDGLVSQAGVYAEMHRQQLLEEELEATS